MRYISIVLVLALFSNPGQLLEAQAVSEGRSAPHIGGSQDEKSIIQYLQSSMTSTGYATRLYFHGTCEVSSGEGVRFPSIRVVPPSGNVKGVQAIREMFRNDDSVKVSVDRSGVVRITIGDVFEPILDTKLSSLRLTAAARYNPDGPGGAIDLIESAAPVQAAMHNLKVTQQPVFYIGLQRPAQANLPHLPSSMRDVTVDQWLDTIGKTFPGVVVYGECTHPYGSHTIDIKFDWFSAH